MFNSQAFKSKIELMAEGMKSHGRGQLPLEIERKVIGGLESIFLRMADRESGIAALQELVRKMELDFSQKFSMNVQHDVEKDIEVGKIQFAFLDSVRRILASVEVQ